MTMVGADADALVAASSRLHAAADDLDSASADLHRSLLAVSWLGAIATKFLQLFESSHQPRMKSSASFIRDAADNLARQAAEQRNASAAGGGGGSGQTVPGLVPRESPDPHNVFGPSVKRVEIGTVQLGVGAGPISVGEDATIRKEFLSDGTVSVTVIDGVSVGPAGKGGEAGVTIDAGNRHYGQDLGGGVDGALTLQGGRVAIFHSNSDADHYITGLQISEAAGQLPVVGPFLRGVIQEVAPSVTGGHVAVYTAGIGVAGNAHGVALTNDYGVNADAHASAGYVTAHYDDGSVGVAWTQSASGSAAAQLAGADEHKVFASESLRMELRASPSGNNQLRVIAQDQLNHSLTKSETVVDLNGINPATVRRLVSGHTSVNDFVAANAGASRTRVTTYSDQLDDYGVGVNAVIAGGGASYTSTTLVQQSERYYHGFDLVPTS